MTKPRKPLNESQTEILEILYKFRFATVELIVRYQELSSAKYTYTRLNLLEERDYIARHYDGSYKIHGKPAIYYILPEGIRHLKTNPDLSVKALNGMYRDDLVREVFMERCLGIFRLFLKFNELYGEHLSFYSKYEITGLEHFPRPLPDAYITLESEQGTNQYMLELIEITMSYNFTRNRINRYIKHFKSDDWEKAGPKYPTILLICENSLLERRIQRMTPKLLDQADADGLKVLTTTTKALIASGAGNNPIWSSVSDPEELVSL